MKDILSSEGITVLSLCDGMSCGQIALKELGINVKQYYASEIKNIAIKVTKDNFPNTIHIGDVNKITYDDGVLYTEHGDFNVGKIDLMMFGSPCQTFSIAMKKDFRTGLENKEKSGLFLECYRILKEVQPKYFLMENVASMKKDDCDYISELMNVQPIMMNSELVSPCLRKRYYWTNIPNVTKLQDRNISFQSILENGFTDRLKARSLLVSDSRPLTTPIKMFHRYYSTGFTTLIFKSEYHYKDCIQEYKRITGGEKATAKSLNDYKGNVFDGVRYMTQTELERCQTVPIGYTKCLSRNEAADVLGDGWNIETIKHILKGLNK